METLKYKEIQIAKVETSLIKFLRGVGGYTRAEKIRIAMFREELGICNLNNSNNCNYSLTLVCERNMPTERRLSLTKLVRNIEDR
jgi:hypothetical protein